MAKEKSQKGGKEQQAAVVSHEQQKGAPPRLAEQFRKDVLKRLWEKQVRLAGEGNEPKGSSKKIDLMIDHIKSIRSGAFVPFIEQPWVRATLIFITSGGGLTVLQYLPWFQ